MMDLHSQRHLELLLNDLPALLYYIDTDYRYRYASGGYRHLLSIDPKAVIGKHITDIFDARDIEEMRRPLERALAGEPQHFVRSQRVTGNERFYKVDYFPDRDPTGSVVGLYGVTLDITEAHRAELHIAELNRRVQHLVDRLPAAIVYLAGTNQVIFRNDAYLLLEACLPGDFAGTAFARAMAALGVPATALAQARNALGGVQQTLDTTVQLADGTRNLHVVLIPDREPQGQQVGLICLATDVTEFKRISDEFERLARTDGLTGLPNRRSADARLDEALRRSARNRQGVGVLFVDLDHFKPVNDRHGHEAGDHVLQQVARRAAALVRDTDLVARLGGDEFLIVLENLDGLAGAEQVAAKLVAAMREPVDWQGQALHVGASVGLVYAPAGVCTDRQAVLAAADLLLYDAKRDGKGCLRSRTLGDAAP